MVIIRSCRYDGRESRVGHTQTIEHLNSKASGPSEAASVLSGQGSFLEKLTETRASLPNKGVYI